MTTDQNDLARRVDEIFARAAHPTAIPSTPSAEPQPVGFQRRTGDRLHSARWLAQPCCCGHQRAAHTHYTASTHCSACRCSRFDRSATWWLFGVLCAGCAFWAFVGFEVSRWLG